MRYRLRKIGLTSTALSTGAVTLIASFVYTVFQAFRGDFGVPENFYGIALTAGFALILIFAYTMAGAVLGVATACIYNLVARYTRGLELEFVDD